MPEPAYSAADLALFVDLDRAAREVDLTPCLIGAGAIQLGSDLRWSIRLSRRTRDWDFVVRVPTWERFTAFATALTAPSGGFTTTNAPHRFRHKGDGLLDVIPHGELEAPPGNLKWPDGHEMNTTGLEALDQHYIAPLVGGVTLRSATLPAIIGLKLLAYLDRRPRGILRDIQDVYALLLEAENVNNDPRIVEECLSRFESGELGFGETGAYLLGRDVGATFGTRALGPIVAFLDDLRRESSTILGDIQQGMDGPRTGSGPIVERLAAFRWGLLDQTQPADA